MRAKRVRVEQQVIKKCPFCGCKPKIGISYIQCHGKRCPANPSVYLGHDKASGINEWNKRV